MDTPLLALTRRRHIAPPPKTEGDNMRQLVQLRWFAVGGQVVTILFVHFGLRVPLPLLPMLSLVALLALANLAVPLISWRGQTNAAILLALLLDMGVLTAQLYFSGGADNPFISLYLLQLVLGAILLHVWSVGLLLVATSLCFAGLTVRSMPLAYPPELLPEIADLRTFGSWVSFALTASLLALFVTRITRNLRARDRYLADLRQHAAEEDGIVRMALFASGAAHELGTPLATLSVILNDWRHLPELAGNTELSSELDDMQAEVGRCKEIVTSILHSAGEPLGEPATRTPAREFIDLTVSAWRPTHANVPLDRYVAGLEEATIAADPALRQAIWNLLDNAAEASPAGVTLEVSRRDGMLIVAVRDRGPGFRQNDLASIGQLYQSSKGAGHGVGLFLVSNVARRLGGRLEAANRAEGGAEVLLILPLDNAGLSR